MRPHHPTGLRSVSILWLRVLPRVGMHVLHAAGLCPVPHGVPLGPVSEPLDRLRLHRTVPVRPVLDSGARRIRVRGLDMQRHVGHSDQGVHPLLPEPPVHQHPVREDVREHRHRLHRLHRVQQQSVPQLVLRVYARRAVLGLHGMPPRGASGRDVRRPHSGVLVGRTVRLRRRTELLG